MHLPRRDLLELKRHLATAPPEDVEHVAGFVILGCEAEQAAALLQSAQRPL